MAPSAYYVNPCREDDNNEPDDVEEDVVPEVAQIDEDCVVEIEPMEEEGVPNSHGLEEQYFVQSESDCDLSSDSGTESNGDGVDSSVRRNLFSLPQVESRGCRAIQVEPLVDCSRSIIMTFDEYLAAMTAKAAKKEAVAKECEEHKIQAEQKKVQHE